MKPYILNEINWKRVQNEQYNIAVLPWGATEPHNLHLPYGTDTLQSGTIGAMAAAKAWEKGVKTMVLPAIPLGVQNPGQIDLPFCLNTRPSTQLLILEDILVSLRRQGIRKLVVINSHGGNDFKSLIRELQPRFDDMFIGVIDWFKAFNNDDFFDEPGDHAGELETSVMQHLFPELVLPLDEAGDGAAGGFKLTGLKDKMAWTPRDWNKVSNDTGVGNPKMATPEKGEKFLDFVTDKIADFFIELNNVESTDIYE